MRNLSHLLILATIVASTNFSWSQTSASSVPGAPPALQGAEVPFTLVGGYIFNTTNSDPKSIQKLNPGLRPNRYGTTTLLQDPTNPATDALDIDSATNKARSIVIRDQHYALYDFSKSPISGPWTDTRPQLGFGMRIIPSVNKAYHSDPPLAGPATESTGANVNGKKVSVTGSSLVDNYLRKVVYKYTGDDAETGPIFAQVAYYHPENFQSQPMDLANNTKTEMGFTHKGTYFGNGITMNSPAGYHGDSWWDGIEYGDVHETYNYPALLSVVTYRGALDKNNNFDVKTFNTNGMINAIILNHSNDGPVFPRTVWGYKFDPIYSVSLETVLDFYFRWLNQDPLLQSDPLYAVYCAEHATDILNTSITLPYNLKAYQDAVQDPGEGERLYNLAGDRLGGALRDDGDDPSSYKYNNAAFLKATYLKSLDANFAKNFIPSYKLDKSFPGGHIVKLRDPNATIPNRSYVATNVDFKIPGKYLAWNPETVADLARDFIREYQPWYKIGALQSATAILFGFASQVKIRMHIGPRDFAKFATPILQKIFLNDAVLSYAKDALKLSNADLQTQDSALQTKFVTARAQADTYIQGLSTKIADSMAQEAANEPAERQERLDGIRQSVQQAVRDHQITQDQADQRITDLTTDLTNEFVMKAEGRLTSEEQTAVATATTTFLLPIEGDAGWGKVKDLYTQRLNDYKTLTRTNTNPDAKTFRDYLYAKYEEEVAPILETLNKVEPEPGRILSVFGNDPDGNPVNGVKYYFAPAVHVRVGLGTHDWNNRGNLRIWHVASVINAPVTAPLLARAVNAIDDRYIAQYDTFDESSSPALKMIAAPGLIQGADGSANPPSDRPAKHHLPAD